MCGQLRRDQMDCHGSALGARRSALCDGAVAEAGGVGPEILRGLLFHPAPKPGGGGELRAGP